MPETLLISASVSMLALTASASAATVKIGLLVRLTRASSADGQEIVKGAELAIKEINNAGGIEGNTLELVIGDTPEGASSDVTAQAQRLLDDSDVHFMRALDTVAAALHSPRDGLPRNGDWSPERCEAICCPVGQ